MSDSISGTASVTGHTKDAPSTVMTLGIIFDSDKGKKPGALAALKVVVKDWAKEYGVKVTFDGPSEV